MTIKIWNAFSPNNSSSCRLVARFEDPRAAREAAVEIATFLIDHIREIDGRWIDSPVANRFAARYGFDVEELFVWTAHFRAGDEPEIGVDDGVLVVFHTYCLGFDHLGRVLEAKGAVVEERHSVQPRISVLFRSVPGESPELDRELAALFAHIDAHGTERPQYRAPWSLHDEALEGSSYFRDAGAVGMWVPCEPHMVPTLESWLARRGVERLSLRWCEDGDEELFRAIALARCTACHAPLEYLDPRIHDIETPQFVCRSCGGLYDREVFT